MHLFTNFYRWKNTRFNWKGLGIPLKNIQNKEVSEKNEEITENVSEIKKKESITYVDNPINRNLEEIRELIINHYSNAGFYSCCCVILEDIIHYFNDNRILPDKINTTNVYHYYKNNNEENMDIRNIYFINNEGTKIEYKKDIFYTTENFFVSKYNLQFCDYSKLNFDELSLFIEKYFTPTNEIINRIYNIEKKYEIDHDNTCVLFHRGNDKNTELDLPSYDEYIVEANKILENDPDIRIFIQSDETEFLEEMKNKYSNNIICYDEIRHMNKTMSTVDSVYREQYNNQEMAKNFLAIMIIMSKCKYVITTALGNCPLWVRLFRGNNDGIIGVGDFENKILRG